MGRIRSIKPELLEHPVVAALADEHFRIMIGLLHIVDDEGRARANPIQIAGLMFWASPRPVENMQRALETLAARGLIALYNVDGFPYLEIIGFRDLRSTFGQRVDHPQPSKLPAPSEAGASVHVPTSEQTTAVAKDTRALSKADLAAQELADVAIAKINALAGTSYRTDSVNTLKLCRALVKAGHTSDETTRVIESRRAWLQDDKMRQHFCPDTLLGRANFEKYLEQLDAARKPALRVVDTGPQQLMIGGEVVDIPGDAS